jgi:hypothetical protein
MHARLSLSSLPATSHILAHSTHKSAWQKPDPDSLAWLGLGL